MTDVRHERMVGRYGFGMFPIPRYREMRGGDWSLCLHRPGMGDGYSSGPLIEAPKFVLYQGRTAWMSTGLMELESHAPHVDAAHGLVMVAGFGMGLYTYAIAQKPEVTKIVVVETDPSLIALMTERGLFEAWPHWDKVTVVLGDALAPDTWRQAADAAGGQAPDYLYADIWPVCPHDLAPEQTREMVGMIRPKRAGWWGQELSFGQWCGRSECAPDAQALDDFFVACGVPWGRPSAGYAQFCADVLALNPMLSTVVNPQVTGFWATVRRLFLPSA
jgi:hypothetical protein